ncbi:membrane protein YpdK [Leclercia sp. LTM14]|uniref:Membrane protein YpdK n=1 Tax=Leclercia barmai TaxID=2785629 RepID=A0ABS7RPU4_9ENTR|nr:membrane protein YpdK [Leclercia sp. EMC7]MCM5699271.1 membrane protein YpdK [Leclercia sp. LTM14]
MDSVFNAYHEIRGAMNVKYFLMGFSVILFAWVGTFALMMN